MSASIRIESGIAAGTSYWIDRPVLRIGSDPQCEICVPSAEVAPHAVTLEFRSGSYRAYNRSASPLTLGRIVLQPSAAGVWNDGDLLELPGDLRLSLAIDGDPRPSPRPDAGLNDGFDDRQTSAADELSSAVTPEAAKAAKSKSLIQMAIIGVCVLGMAGLLMLSKGGESAAGPTPNRPTFSAIVESSLKKSDNIRSLVQKLQYAQSFIVRGNTERARTSFTELRDQLSRQIDSLPPDDRKDAEIIRDFVETQLGKLQ
jgi:hypothetical protein